jgi:hypothetical protein
MGYYDELWTKYFTQHLPNVTQNPFNLHLTSTQIDTPPNSLVDSITSLNVKTTEG